MLTAIAFGFWAIVIAFLCAIAIGGLWVLWLAATAVPKPARMRWPWTIWLLIVPVISPVVAWFVLVALAGSYRRYFSQKNLPGHGGCGYGTAMAAGVLSWLSLLRGVPRPNAAVAKRWPHLPGLVHFVHLASGWAAAAGGVAVLALAIMMWDLRRQAERIGHPVTNDAPANEALAWLEGNLDQPPPDGPTSDPPPRV